MYTIQDEVFNVWKPLGKFQIGCPTWGGTHSMGLGKFQGVYEYSPLVQIILVLWWLWLENSTPVLPFNLLVNWRAFSPTWQKLSYLGQLVTDCQDNMQNVWHWRTVIKSYLMSVHGPAGIGSCPSVWKGFRVTDLTYWPELYPSTHLFTSVASMAKWSYDILVTVYFLGPVD